MSLTNGEKCGIYHALGNDDSLRKGLPMEGPVVPVADQAREARRMEVQLRWLQRRRVRVHQRAMALAHGAVA